MAFKVEQPGLASKKLDFVEVVGMEYPSFYPSRFFYSSNNQVNTRQINRRKAYLIPYIWVTIKVGDPGQLMQLRLISSAELRNSKGTRGF